MVVVAVVVTRAAEFRCRGILLLLLYKRQQSADRPGARAPAQKSVVSRDYGNVLKTHRRRHGRVISGRNMFVILLPGGDSGGARTHRRRRRHIFVRRMTQIIYNTHVYRVYVYIQQI